jgi:hypothetical protein
MAEDPTLIPATYVQEMVLSFVAPDGTTVVPLSAANPLPIGLMPTQAPVTLAADTAFNFMRYGSVLFNVQALSGGDTIALTGTTGTDYTPVSVINLATLTAVTAINADGNYAAPGGMNIKWTQAGSASTPVVTVSAGA